MFETIIAATDGSAHGTRASEVAAELAGRLGARLVLLSVVSPDALPSAITGLPSKDRGASPHPLLACVPS